MLFVIYIRDSIARSSPKLPHGSRRGRLCRDGGVAKPTNLKSVPKITRNGTRQSRNGQPALEKERFSGGYDKPWNPRRSN